MKILVFSSLYPNNMWPNHGIFVKERMTHWSKLPGCKLEVVAPVPYYPPIRGGQRWAFSQVVRQECIEGVSVHHPRYLMIPKVGMVFHGLILFAGVLSFVKQLRRTFSFDLIDAHYVYPDGFAAVLLGRYLQCPVVVSARGSDIHQFSEMRFIRPLLRWTLRHADKVIAVSTGLKEGIMRLGCREDKLSVIPNGVDTTKFFPSAQEVARRKAGLPDGKIILSVARLVPNKGCDLLVHALKVVIDEYRENRVYLVLVGEGPSLGMLQELCEKLGLTNEVFFVGGIPHRDLHLWYSSAAVSCLASEREGCPNVILESLACGTPVVATRVGGVPDMIPSEAFGLLIDRDISSFGRAIVRALHKQWDRKRIIDHVETFTWNQVALRVHEVFESLVVKETCMHPPSGTSDISPRSSRYLPGGTSRSDRCVV